MPFFEGSGVVIVHSQTTVLDNDETKALGAGGNDAVIIPAQGENKIIHLLRGSAILDATAGAYSGTVAGSGWALFTDANAGIYVSAVVPVHGVINVALVHPMIFSAYATGSSHMVGEDDLVRTLITEVPTGGSPANKPLVISDWFANGAYGDGNAANTLRVTVAYMIQDVITGEFS